MNYYVKLNITNKEYICTHTNGMLHDKVIVIDKPKLNPSGLEVVETIISKLGIGRIYKNAGAWKRDYIDEVNNRLGTNHSIDMPFDEFLKVLNKDGTIIIEYLDDKKDEKKEVETKETSEKYVPF